MIEIDLSIGDSFAHEIVLDVSMFQFHVKSWITRDDDSAVVVAKEWGCSELSKLKANEQFLEPNQLLRCFRGGNIFSFTSRQGNKLLAAQTPGN